MRGTMATGSSWPTRARRSRPPSRHKTGPPGAAGLLFVGDEEEAALRRALDLALGETEIPLVLQDRNFDAQGRLQYQVSREEMFQGFLGERLLVNLTEKPFIAAGRRIYRVRVLHGSYARCAQ